MSDALLSAMFKGFLPSTVKPQLTQDAITINITEQEFFEMATKGMDDRVRKAITIKIKEGTIEIAVKLL